MAEKKNAPPKNGGHVPGATIKPLVKLPKNPSDCWQYLGAIDRTTGYGKKQWHGRSYLAHRWLWMQLFGPIPDDLPLHNICDNKACMNPYHWGISTQADICRDSVRTVLTAGDVTEIKRVPKAQRKTKIERASVATALAQRFGCSRQLIYDIWKGRAWAKPSPPARATRPYQAPQEVHEQ